jgi:hypothetical protein
MASITGSGYSSIRTAGYDDFGNYLGRPQEMSYGHGVFAQIIISEYEREKLTDPNYQKYIRENLTRMFLDSIADQLLCGDPIAVQARWTTFFDRASGSDVIQIRGRLLKVESVEVRMYKVPEFEPSMFQGQPVTLKTLCGACFCDYHDDGRGRCSACGAPGGWKVKDSSGK